MKRSLFNSSMIILYILTVCFMIGFAYFSSNYATVSSERAIIYNRKTVVIDAGHGGIDGGATSCSGITESQTNLEIALKLKDVFNLLGIRTVMIRTEDISVYTSGETIAAKKVSDLKQRVRIVNEHPGCLFLSIHQNYFSQSQYWGAQVFYNQNENAKRLAASMQSAFVQYLNHGSNRQSKKADGIYLMEHIQPLGLLIECGFISNPKEDKLLQCKEYQQKITMVIGSVISLYLNT